MAGPKAVGAQMTDMELQDLVFALVQSFLARPFIIPSFWSENVPFVWLYTRSIHNFFFDYTGSS